MILINSLVYSSSFAKKTYQFTVSTIRLSKNDKYTKVNLAIQSANYGRTEDTSILDLGSVQALISHNPPRNQIKS